VPECPWIDARSNGSDAWTYGAVDAAVPSLHRTPAMRTPSRVLVVDDYGPNLDGLRRLLEQQGYVVMTASNGHEALEIVANEHPDLVLTDVVMPQISGVDVCAAIKGSRDTCLTPVVLISASHERDTRLTGLGAGADDFLNKPVDPEELYTRVRSLLRLKRMTDDLESAESLFMTLGRIIEARDPSTEGHCERLASYASALGAALELDQADLDSLYRGAYLHDVGKIGIPDRILLKKGKLTRAEYELMKRHAVIGDELCETVRAFDAVRPIVRHHHERRDGRGYPDGLAGDAIPMLARIVSVVDVYDALTSDRPYRKAMTAEAAFRIMRDEARGGWCDRAMVETFIELRQQAGGVKKLGTEALEIVA
jgi:putative two-component system response regulator